MSDQGINANEATATDLRVIEDLKKLGWKVGDTLLYQPQYPLNPEQQKEFPGHKYVKPDIVLQDLQGTPLILDELDRRKLRAVFFVMGQHIVRNRPEDLARRDLLRKLAVHGHHVGNHTMNHKDLCRNPDALAEEVDHAAELITYATGVRPLLFRSPYGARCHSLDRALAERDLTQVGWNADPREWRGNSENAIATYVTSLLARATAPVILLLHDKNMAAVQALPRILDWIEREKARVAREGGVPIRIVDYSVLLPVPQTTLQAQSLPR